MLLAEWIGGMGNGLRYAGGFVKGEWWVQG